MTKNFKKPPTAGFGVTKVGAPASRFSLSSILTRATATALGSQRVTVEVDVDERLECVFPSEAMFHLVAALVRGAVDAAGCGGEITVTAWQRAETLEIEVADNGPAIESRPKRLPMAAAALSAELVWQNCPQGGAAVTAVLRRKEWLREAA